MKTITLELNETELAMFAAMVTERRETMIRILNRATTCPDDEWQMLRNNINFLNKLVQEL